MNRMGKIRVKAGAALVGTALAVAGLGSAQTKSAKSDSQKETDAGIRFHLQVSEKEIGLPIYPGAKPHKDEKDESPAANIGLWGNSFGFKLVVLKMETPDAPAKVAAFYQKALAKYGKVLDCSKAPAKSDAQGTKQSSSAITCDDTPETGAMLFKSGTHAKQHIVGIEANGQGSKFEMVLLDTRGIETEEHPL
ncbi:MAG TPA: hypothetical protein VKP58_15495 [Candidatus Acidoferrum sp.]|nr:hypothetical protein [Candidatus Acidoferrum sp.]